MLSTQQGAALLCLLLSSGAAHADDGALVRVQVTAESIEIQVPGEPPQHLPWGEPGKQDDELRSFSRALHDIQKEHHTSDTLVLTPVVPMTYPTLTALMDAARAMPIETRRGDAQTQITLFDEVVLERLVVTADSAGR